MQNIPIPAQRALPVEMAIPSGVILPANFDVGAQLVQQLTTALSAARDGLDEDLPWPKFPEPGSEA